MPGHDIIVIGASAGGVEALMQLVGGLPPDLPASVFIVTHLAPDSPSFLPNILTRAGRLPASHPRDQDTFQPGHIYLAPPNRHLLLEPGMMRVLRSPRANGYRPAVDVLFQSAAQAYGRRVVGVILTGALSDGTAGLAYVKRGGGATIAQDPATALYPEMPASAIQHVRVDHVLPLDQIAPMLVQLAVEGVVMQEPQASTSSAPSNEENEQKLIEQDKLIFEEMDIPNESTVLTCPECGGVLWQVDDGELVHFRCHVGHTYSLESMIENQDGMVEQALWTAIRALEERSMLMRRLAARMDRSGGTASARRFEQQAQEAERSANVVRHLVLDSSSSEHSQSGGDLPGPEASSAAPRQADRTA